MGILEGMCAFLTRFLGKRKHAAIDRIQLKYVPWLAANEMSGIIVTRSEKRIHSFLLVFFGSSAAKFKMEKLSFLGFIRQSSLLAIISPSSGTIVRRGQDLLAE